MQIKIPKGIPTIAINELRPYTKNIKIHSKEQIEAIAEAIKLLGVFKDLVVIDKKKTIWIGHGRVEAAKLLGMTRIPYVYNDHLSDQNKKALMLLDNKVPEMATYNKNNMQALILEIPGFNFTPFHLTLDDFHILPNIQEDRIPKPPRNPKTKHSQIYQLGNHRVMCGDSTNKDDVLKLMAGKLVDEEVTDPPYGVGYGAKNTYLQTLHKSNRIETPIENDQDIKDYRKFYKSFLENIPFTEYNTFYIFMSGLQLHNLRMAVDDCNLKWGDYLVWLKNQSVFGRKDYFAKHEFILYGWKNKHRFFGDYGSTLIEYNRPQKQDLHPTAKPVGLLAKLIHDGSKRGMIIHDSFLGSGSTLIACEQTGRICYGMEIDPSYVDVTIQRWEKLTSKKARLS